MKPKNTSLKISTSTWISWIVPPMLLGLITSLVYWPSLHYDFQFDDIANILKYFNIRHNSLQKLFFSGPRWISYWLNALHYQIGKFDPFSYRVGNVLIHVANGTLIFLITFTILSCLKQKKNFFSANALNISIITALLFLLHPVQTQTISYVIQGQLEGLATLSILSMVFCFLQLAQVNKLFLKVFLTIIFFCLAVLSCGTKEIAIISPALLLLVDWFAIAQGSWKSLKKRLWLHALLIIFIGGAFLYLLKPKFFLDILGLQMHVKNNIGNVITANPGDKITPLTFFISQFKVILHYIGIFLWPFNISVEYDWVLSEGFFSADCFLPFLVLLLIGFILLQIIRRNKTSMFAFGSLWFFLCLGPRSSIIPSAELIVDYKTYMASFGILFLIAVALTKLINMVVTHVETGSWRLQKPVLQFSLILMIIAPIGWLTVERNTIWRSGLEFWGSIIKNAPGKARAYNNYGVELSQKLHQFEESVPYFKKAIAMDNNYPDPCNNLAVAYSQLEKIDLAIGALQRGLKIHPYYPEGYNNLASFFLQKNDTEQAEKALRIALRLRPHYGKAFFNLGRVHLQRNEQEKAWECFKNCCTKGDLDNEFGYSVYAKSSLQLKKYNDAIYAFKKLLEVSPNYPDALFNLANSYHLNNQFNKAIPIYQGLTQKYPHEFKIWYNLGEAYLKNQQPTQALASYQKIESRKHQIPNWYIRVAACYEKMGNVAKSQQLLQELIDTNPSQQIKDTTTMLLTQMKQRYSRS